MLQKAFSKRITIFSLFGYDFRAQINNSSWFQKVSVVHWRVTLAERLLKVPGEPNMGLCHGESRKKWDSAVSLIQFFNLYIGHSYQEKNFISCFLGMWINKNAVSGVRKIRTCYTRKPTHAQKVTNPYIFLNDKI